ncbi:MAG TPA: alpha/beta hydrolase [Flavisolibacter sp.]|jgi:pimeloyl-ACP methyl ester carboxylesterase|nr:alpha/beta hydrolase [Flavisolibacter sp.]
MLPRTVSVNKKTLSYHLSGEGIPVLLLHGFGEDSRVWKNLEKDISGYTWVVPDLPGTQASDLLEDMSMEGMAAAMAGLMEQLGYSSYVVIGHSMGGYIALALAEKFPERLKGFGLFHSTAFPDTEEKKQIRLQGMEAIRQKGAFAFLQTATPKLYAPLTKAENPQIIQDHIESIRNFSPETLVLYYQGMIARPDRTAVLQKIQVPVLLIFGKYDSAVPLEDGLKLAHLPDLSYIHILDHSGHMGMAEEPGKTNLIIQNYLSGTTT